MLTIYGPLTENIGSLRIMGKSSMSEKYKVTANYMCAMNMRKYKQSFCINSLSAENIRS